MLKYAFPLCCLLHFSTALTAQFSPFCSGITNGFVVDFETFQNQIHATGFFKTVCGKNTGYIAKWDGTQWVGAAMGGIAEGHALAAIDGALYIASYEFGVDSNYVLRWNGTHLTTIGSVYRTNPNPTLSQTASIYDIIEYQGDIVVCGEFNRVAGQPVSGIARWNTVRWDSLGSGFSGWLNPQFSILAPHQMTVFGGDLVVCGNFLNAGGKTVNGIARWDGQEWHAFGEGFNDAVYGLGVFNGVLYAGGAFTASGSTELGLIARWNGTSWENPGFKLSGTSPFVHTIKQVGDSLYVAGGFNRVELSSGAVLSASGIIALNSAQQINTLGGGVPNREIEAILPWNGGVLIGGGGPLNSGYLGFWNPATTSVVTLNEAPFWAVYPNPAKNVLKLEGVEQLDYTVLSLYDNSGKVCLQINLNESNEEINLTGLPGGIYQLQLSGSKTRSPAWKRVAILGE